ncbi:TniQ family protein [Streptomyces sp. NPDC059985]|uniref:TniQ family protein n=1 Tax=Streptomyces sp. NPDC059985 TaxID=3347025 RepID=UPI0036802599
MNTPAAPFTNVLRPTTPAGALRVRPLPDESAASYLHRLAHAYRVESRQLCEGIGITVHGRPGSTLGGAEISLSPAALHHLTVFTRIPGLQLALGKGVPEPGVPDAGQPTARWQLLEPTRQPTRTCPRCTLHHSRGTTSQAWAYHRAHQRLCPQHLWWATSPTDQASLDARALPELVPAHHAHQRLTRRPDATAAYQWATAITTRWYDHQQHLNRRWRARLARLARTNPPPPGGTSWALTGRDPVTYPETIALARHLTQTPHGQTDRNFLDQTAHALGLDRLVLPPGDLLWAWIHTKQEHPRPHCL